MSVVQQERAKLVGTSALGTLAIILLWELISGTVISELTLPAPTMILAEGIDLADLILPALVGTFQAAAYAYALAVVSGIVSGLVLFESDRLNQTFMPLVVAGNTLPKVALAPLLVFYFGGGFGKVLVGAWIAYFPIVINTLDGLDTASEDTLLLLDSLGVSKLQEYRLVRLPSALPFLFDGLKIGVNLAVIGVVTAEFVLPSEGGSIGGLALLALLDYNVDIAFAVVITTGIIAVSAFFLVFIIQDRLVHWKESSLFSE